MFYFVLSFLCCLYLLKMVSRRADEESFCCANNNHVILERLRNELNRRTLKKKNLTNGFLLKALSHQ